MQIQRETLYSGTYSLCFIFGIIYLKFLFLLILVAFWLWLSGFGIFFFLLLWMSLLLLPGKLKTIDLPANIERIERFAPEIAIDIE